MKRPTLHGAQSAPEKPVAQTEKKPDQPKAATEPKDQPRKPRTLYGGRIRRVGPGEKPGMSR